MSLVTNVSLNKAGMPANHESLAIWVDANTWILSLKQWQLQAQAVTQQSLVDNLIFGKLKQNYSI